MYSVGYSKTQEVKIVRSKHKITFNVGMTVAALIDLLSKVPPHAIVDEVIDDIGEELSSIEFHEEKRE